MGINETSEKHFEWVSRMGWGETPVLVQMALIASEVGEAINECRDAAPSEHFKTELADIVLRVMGLAQSQGIDLESAIEHKMLMNETLGTKGRLI